jgi:hypothetical protein
VSTQTRQTVVISPSGEVRAIYSPLTAQIAKAMGGAVTTRRASHVEPTADLSERALRELEEKFKRETKDLQEIFVHSWWADMTPVGGPVLGPYDTREEALNDEKVWLEEHNIPVAASPTPSLA